MNADLSVAATVPSSTPAGCSLKTSKEFVEVHKYADPDTMYRA